MKEAMLWKPRDGAVLCALCAHRCSIPEGERGLCGVRQNVKGTLYSLVYGKLISTAVDPIEKKPLFNFLPGTRSYSIASAGCNFFCDFCQNWQISQMSRRDGAIRGEEFTPEEVVAEAAAYGCASVAYTYTEPTVFFEFALDTAVLAKRAGIKNVFVTNGYQTRETVEKMTGAIDAANVDLKAFSDDFYRCRCRARLAPVLESIRLMHAGGIFLEITTLVIPGENDSPDELKGLVEFIASVSADIPWHVSRFHPDYNLRDRDPTPADTIFEAAEIGKAGGLKYVYAGNMPAGQYEHTYCPGCGAVVVERSGFRAKNVGLDGRACRRCGAELNLVV
jgi:pyruvate formate lyase activating enzyme